MDKNNPEKKIEKITKELQEHAQKNGFSLNPDEKIIKAIIKGFLEKEKEFGARYCPCRKISGKAQEDKKIICPCFYHFAEIKEYGRCLCNLFVKDV